MRTFMRRILVSYPVSDRTENQTATGDSICFTFLRMFVHHCSMFLRSTPVVLLSGCRFSFPLRATFHTVMYGAPTVRAASGLEAQLLWICGQKTQEDTNWFFRATDLSLVI